MQFIVIINYTIKKKKSILTILKNFLFLFKNRIKK